MRLAMLYMLLLQISAGVAIAQSQVNFPSRQVRLIVPVAPGGTQDAIARAIAGRLAAEWGQQVVVDNRPGAGGSIGMDIAARSVPDGHVIVSAQNGILCIAPNLDGKLSYDPVRDFAPILQTATGPNVLAIHPSVPVRSFKDFVVFARQRPGAVTYGSSGNGSLGHLIGSLLGREAKITLLHVPYKGGGQAVIDVIGGQVSAIILGLAGPMPHIRAGRLRPLAVTSAKRAASLPDVPAIAEGGYPVDAASWFALLAPAGTPQGIIRKINGGVVAALKHPDVQKHLEAAGFEVTGSSPDAFGKLIKSELAQWNKVVRETGMRAD